MNFRQHLLCLLAYNIQFLYVRLSLVFASWLSQSYALKFPLFIQKKLIMDQNIQQECSYKLMRWAHTFVNICELCNLKLLVKIWWCYQHTRYSSVLLFSDFFLIISFIVFTSENTFFHRPLPPKSQKPLKNFRIGRPLPRWGENLPQDVSSVIFAPTEGLQS